MSQDAFSLPVATALFVVALLLAGADWLFGAEATVIGLFVCLALFLVGAWIVELRA